jgi:hypothetical protein
MRLGAFFAMLCKKERKEESQIPNCQAIVFNRHCLIALAIVFNRHRLIALAIVFNRHCLITLELLS